MKYEMKSDKFFTEEEKKRIAETTRAIETRTIGEVAVMVVNSSDRYLEAEVLGGVFLGGLLSLVIATFFFHSSLLWYILFSFLLFLPATYAVSRVPSLKITFTGVKRREAAVRQRALGAFYEKGLYKTQNNTGVLFFLSLLERKVWVLADKGIYEKIDQGTLDKFAGIVSHGIKAGRPCDSLCEAMNLSGDLLAKYFPVTPGDTNELSNEVIITE